jgi:DNA invertase Pin-like site-specific DNA recombinase
MSQTKRDARRFAESRGLTIGEVFTDLNESGGTLERPGFAKVLRRIERGESAGVVVAYLSRASRDTVQGLELLSRISSLGAELYAPNLPDYTTPDGRMLATIQFAIDTGYLDRKAAEFEQAKRGAIEAGIPIAHQAPIGYRKRADRRLEPDPVTAPIVRRVFEERAKGAGPTALARMLDESGIRTAAKSPAWTKSAVQQLIANRVYLGELSYGRPPRYVNREAHEPIVDVALWQAAQHPNGKRPAPPRTGAFTLAGVLRCEACGYAMNGTRTSRDRGSKRVYRCRRRHAGGICPAPAYVLADSVERVVHGVYADLLQAVLEHHRPGGVTLAGKPAPSLDALEGALATAEVRVAESLKPEMASAAGEDWPTVVRNARAARDAAALALGHARAELGEDAVTVSIEEALAMWERASTTTQRELIAKWLPTITLSVIPATRNAPRSTWVHIWPQTLEQPVTPQRGKRRDDDAPPKLCPIEDAEGTFVYPVPA